MGIMPDYTFSDPGVKVDGVTEGKPASKAGLQQGDIILELGEFQITDMQAYMKALAAHKKGDTVKVKVKRGAESKVMEVTF